MASVGVGAEASLSSAGGNPVRSAAKPPGAAGSADIERHFALGMQESAAQFAANRLSQDGTDPSGAAASLDASERRFKALVSRLVAPRDVVPRGVPAQASAAQDPSAQDDASAPAADGPAGAAPSATPDEVHRAYADA